MSNFTGGFGSGGGFGSAFGTSATTTPFGTNTTTSSTGLFGNQNKSTFSFGPAAGGFGNYFLFEKEYYYFLCKINSIVC